MKTRLPSPAPSSPQFLMLIELHAAHLIPRSVWQCGYCFKYSCSVSVLHQNLGGCTHHHNAMTPPIKYKISINIWISLLWKISQIALTYLSIIVGRIFFIVHGHLGSAGLVGFSVLLFVVAIIASSFGAVVVRVWSVLTHRRQTRSWYSV